MYDFKHDSRNSFSSPWAWFLLVLLAVIALLVP